MTRIVEVALLLTPLAAYLLWRALLHRGIPNPSRRTLIAMTSALVVLAALLAWASLTERTQGDTRYVPAEWRNGRMIPGHGG